MSVIVSGLCRYPVKSLAASPVEQLAFSALGPCDDRRWMIVDDEGRFLSQRQLAGMCRLHADVVDGVLQLHHLDSAQRFSVLPPQRGDTASRMVTVWSDTVEALDAGEQAAVWLSGHLNRSVRLVYFPDDSFRQVDPNFATLGEGVGFADGFPALVCNLATLRVLQETLDERGWEQSLSIWRFRPNIVLDGAPPFAELGWRAIRIGSLEFELVKPCSRCVIPSLNPDDGRQQAEVLRVLHEHCRGEDKQIYFGQNALVRPLGRQSETAMLNIGAAVEVVR